MGGLSVVAGLLLWLGAGWALRDAWPRLDAPRRATAVVIVLAWAGFTVLNAYWLGGTYFYAPAHACALAVLALWAGAGGLAPASRRQALGGAVFVGLALAAWNVRSGLLPQSRIENNPGYRQAMFVGAHTEPSSCVVITGLGFSNAKVYLPNFAHRTREVLEYYFDRNPKDVALGKLAGFVSRLTEHGIPMYVLSDLIESPTVAAEMQRRWGVQIADIQQAFGPGRVVLVAASADEKVFIYVPQARQYELFVVLGYSVLTENEPILLSESAAVLKEIVREMSPAERRRAAALMRDKNWGFDMLFDFRPAMSPESLAATRVREQNFAAYAKTLISWLRAGNLYNILGLKAETITPGPGRRSFPATPAS